MIQFKAILVKLMYKRAALTFHYNLNTSTLQHNFLLTRIQNLL